jgi:hypothetical protein
MNQIAAISSDNFRAIQAAMTAFAENGLSIAGYEINVFEEANRFIVLFKKAGLSAGYRGSPPGFPGFEVELDASNLNIVKSNFVR